MDKIKFNELLKKLHACNDAIGYCEDKSLSESWEQSERGDWMLWLLKKINLDDRKLTLAKARCTKLIIHLMKDQRSIDAVNAAENYGLGKIEKPELNAAAAAAAAAYAAAYAYAYAYAYAAAYAAAYAYSAAYSAAYAAAAYAAAAADVADKNMLNNCAIEIRKVVSLEDILNLIKE